MKTQHSTQSIARPARRLSGPLPLLLLALIALVCTPAPAATQSRAQGKLPAPEKVVGDYVKAVGGKKRLAAVRDAVYEWQVRRGGREAGTARTRTKAPASARTDLLLVEDGELTWAANARSAWTREGDAGLRTLTDREAYSSKLHALLDAGHLLDFKKQKVMARTVGLEQVGGEPAYTVEFSTREGARLRYSFSAATKLLVRVSDEARGLTVTLGDYRAGALGALEPHRLELARAGGESFVLTLREARYNTGLSDALFDPPAEQALDIPALLKDLARNQTEIDRRVNDYTFTRKATERKLNDRGEVKEEKVLVHEVYPFVGWGWVMKLVSENGRPLSAERAAEEERRVASELEKAEREAPKRLEKWQRERAERAAKKKAKGGGEDGLEDDADDDVGIATFLRACEFVSPRRERFRERDVVVFDFRARKGFRPSTRGESIAAKLAGVVWVDPVERQVMRLEARFVQGYKVAGGLLASLKEGSAFVFEQTRLEDGLWMPRFSQVNISLRLFLVSGTTINQTQEFSDFKRFSTKSGDATLDAPKP